MFSRRRKNLLDKTDAELQELYLKGVPFAFTVLFDKYAESAIHLSYAYLQDQAKAEEIVQDVMLKLNDKIIEGTKIMYVRSWINRAVKNKSIDVLRKKKTDLTFEDDCFGESTLEQFLQETELTLARYRQLFIDEVLSFEARKRYVLMSYVIHGDKFNQIAEHLEIDASTVRKYYHNSLRGIRRRILKIIAEEGLYLP